MSQNYKIVERLTGDVKTELGVSNRLVDRLRGKYASGPHLPNGNPEFGWRQFECTPLQQEAADAIEQAASLIQELGEALETTKVCLNQALGIVVEFGDLNGFRNLSDQELGKAVVSMAERAARIVNDADAILSKLKET